MKDDQASSTAFTVLQGILYVAKSSPYNYLVDDEVVKVGRQILNASEEGRKRLKQLQSPWTLMSIKLKELLILPGITLHYILRKRYVEAVTRQALSDGVTQIVMLGAGFDTLSWRLHQKHSDVNFIEIDHPATQKVKVEALDKGDDKGSNMHFLSVDFSSQDLQSRLGEFAGFEPHRPTLFICEGVLMYLSEQDVDLLFKSIKHLSGSGTQFLYSTLEPKQNKKNTIPGLLYHHLKFIGEPINWDIDSEVMESYLQKQQCELKSMAGRDELIKFFIKDDIKVRLHSGEYFTHTQFSG
ncbi:MAG: class I SAM-dependent methyltransferase [Colwellia sp.]|jgi:methyltransferase, putative, TIGR00027 family